MIVKLKNIEGLNLPWLSALTPRNSLTSSLLSIVQLEVHASQMMATHISPHASHRVSPTLGLFSKLNVLFLAGYCKFNFNARRWAFTFIADLKDGVFCSLGG